MKAVGWCAVVSSPYGRLSAGKWSVGTVAGALNRHGNLGTYSGDKNGDNPLLQGVCRWGMERLFTHALALGTPPPAVATAAAARMASWVGIRLTRCSQKILHLLRSIFAIFGSSDPQTSPARTRVTLWKLTLTLCTLAWLEKRQPPNETCKRETAPCSRVGQTLMRH